VPQMVMGMRLLRPEKAVNGGCWAQEQVWCNGDAWFASLLDAIANAQRQVWLETYILARGQLGERVVGALAAASRRGCEVRLLVDGVGAAAWFQHDSVDRLGFPLRVWHPLPWAAAWRAGVFPRWRWLASINRRDHRKVCLIDGAQAWVGSFNVDDCHLQEFSGDQAWRDCGAAVRGDGVATLIAAYEHTWRRSWPMTAGRLRLRAHLTARLGVGQPQPAVMGRPASNLVRLNHTWATRRAAYRDLLRRIHRASTRIWITNAYVVPRGTLMRALGAAARRGVDVRLLVPAHADIAFMPWVGAVFADSLHALGVRIFAYLPGMLHAKTMLIDDLALVGSHNLNSRSFRHDLEAEVVLSAPTSVAALEQTFADDCARSRELLGSASAELTWIQRRLGRLLVLAKWFL